MAQLRASGLRGAHHRGGDRQPDDGEHPNQIEHEQPTALVGYVLEQPVVLPPEQTMMKKLQARHAVGRCARAGSPWCPDLRGRRRYRFQQQRDRQGHRDRPPRR